MGYYSQTLLKEYKTTRGAKVALGRYLNEMTEEYNDIKTARLSGWECYLGDNIHARERDTKNEIQAIKTELSILNNLKQ